MSEASATSPQRDTSRRLCRPWTARANPCLRALVAAMAALMLTAGLWLAGALPAWELRLWDWRASLFAAPSPHTEAIHLITLDQASLDWAYEANGLSWPWPRELYAVIIDFCRRAGAKAVAFDVLFTEPSAYGVQDDATLARAAGRSEAFIAAAFLGDAVGRADTWPRRAPRLPQPEGLDALLSASAGSPKLREVLTPARGVFPIAELASNATLLGAVDAAPDDDGVYRRVRLLRSFDSVASPSLALASFLAGEEAAPTLRFQEKSLRIGHGEAAIRVPLDETAQSVLRFRGPADVFTSDTAAAVIRSELLLRSSPSAPAAMIPVDPERLAGKYVFFGFTAPGLFDLRPTPVDPVTPGVVVWATALDNLLADDFATPLRMEVVVVFCMLTALAVGALGAMLAHPLRQALVLAGSTSGVVTVGFAGYAMHLWLPMAAPLVTAVGASAVAMILTIAVENRQRRFIKTAFSQYLHPSVVEQLLAQPDRLSLGGERREISIFFSDLEGFTALSEKLAPEALVAFLNEYLTAMTDILLAHGGTVDKYEGDAIIAFWNAPLEQPDHAWRALAAAMACQAKLDAMGERFAAVLGARPRMRIGLNTGWAVVGNLGSHTRFDYTMIGDAVNVAARLESLNKQFGSRTLLSGALRDALPADAQSADVRFRFLGRIAVMGRAEPVSIFEPLTAEAYTQRRDEIEAFDHALARFCSGDIESARADFTRLAETDPAAAPYRDHCELLCCEADRRDASVSPEPWDGALVMRSK